MIKYKEQMNKISVDNDMKKRVMNKIKENYTEEPVYRGHRFYKYGRFIAACCAFVVTYGMVLNHQELINQKDIHINDDEYSLENQKDVDKNDDGYSFKKEEDMNLNYTEDNIKRERNDENNYIEEYSYNDVIKTESENKEINESQNININIQKDTSSYNSFEDIKEKSNIEENINSENNINIADDNKINNNSQEDEVYNEIQETEDNLYDDISIKTAYYEEGLTGGSYLPDNVPDLSEAGFEMVYLNQMSKNNLEIMYSDENRKLLIEIYDKEIIDLKNEYSIISNVKYNDKEVFLCINKEKETKSIVYIKNNYVYCISSDMDMNESFIEKLIEYI